MLYIGLSFVTMADEGIFSLEDEHMSEMFITQTPKENLFEYMDTSQSENKSVISGNKFDFASPCASLVNAVKGSGPVYEDISDDDTVFQCSQNTPNFQ